MSFYKTIFYLKRKYLLAGIMIILQMGFSGMVSAEELQLIKNIEGLWKFSIGDNMQWSGSNFNDKDWDRINAPAVWETQGYNGYNGFAWYRKTFKLSDIESDKEIVLKLGRIDDVDEVFINGKKVGQSGAFFPNYKTAYDKERKYIVPKGILKPNSDNVIAIRVYDSYDVGGITNGPLGIYYDVSNDLLEINLAGEWRFALSKGVNTNLSKLKWSNIKVPAYWENEGYEDYDGYAVYSKKVTISKELAANDLVLVLGKIDDYDYVYFNGKLIGSVFDLKKEGAYIGNGNEYSALRAYRIPDDLIKVNASNSIVVKVYDYFKDGGIYEGPVGIMKIENFKIIKKKYYPHNSSLWDLIFN